MTQATKAPRQPPPQGPAATSLGQADRAEAGAGASPPQLTSADPSRLEVQNDGDAVVPLQRQAGKQLRINAGGTGDPVEFGRAERHRPVQWCPRSAVVASDWTSQTDRLSHVNQAGLEACGVAFQPAVECFLGDWRQPDGQYARTGITGHAVSRTHVAGSIAVTGDAHRRPRRRG